eukprot:g66292.t1
MCQALLFRCVFLLLFSLDAYAASKPVADCLESNPLRIGFDAVSINVTEHHEQLVGKIQLSGCFHDSSRA